MDNKDSITPNQKSLLAEEIRKEIMLNFNIREDQASNIAWIILNNYTNKHGLIQ